MFLYSAYTANIVSLLQSPSKNIRTLTDLYNSKLTLGLEDTPYNRYYISPANVDDPLKRKILLDKLAPAGQKDHYIKDSVGIANVRKGMYAFFMEESRAYQAMEDTFFEHEKCELVNIDYIKFADPFLAIRKRSQLKEILKVK